MNIISADEVNDAPAQFLAAMSVADLAIALSTLVSMRTTAGLTSNLSNHMRREALEDFSDSLSEALGDQIEAIEFEIRSRPATDPADAAQQEELLLVAGNALRPGELAENLKVGRIDVLTSEGA